MFAMRRLNRLSSSAFHIFIHHCFFFLFFFLSILKTPYPSNIFSFVSMSLLINHLNCLQHAWHCVLGTGCWAELSMNLFDSQNASFSQQLSLRSHIFLYSFYSSPHCWAGFWVVWTYGFVSLLDSEFMGRRGFFFSFISVSLSWKVIQSGCWKMHIYLAE